MFKYKILGGIPIIKSITLRSPKGPYWFKQYVGECPLCGCNMGYKEKVRGVKPKDLSEVYIPLSLKDSYCGCQP